MDTDRHLTSSASSSPPPPPWAFDWYSATVPASAYTVSSIFAEMVPGASEAEFVPAKLPPYPQAQAIAVGDRKLLTCAWRDDQATHVRITGTAARSVVPILRQAWPDHGVSRLDACLDFLGGSPVYDQIRAAALPLIESKRLWSREITDPAQRDREGRTLYIGSPSSPVRARVYEKGLHPDAPLQDLPADLVRIEFQARPSKAPAKRLAASLMPSSVSGGCVWGRDLVETVTRCTPEPWVAGTFWQPTDDERSYRHMVDQYGPMLNRRLERIGEARFLGSLIRDIRTR